MGVGSWNGVFAEREGALSWVWFSAFVIVMRVYNSMRTFLVGSTGMHGWGLLLCASCRKL
jgi:hypothetical protein